MSHLNNGNCAKCFAVSNTFPGIQKDLWGWFIAFQAKYPNIHISCAGRGYKEQERVFAEKKSNARYGESAHNYNCAIDTFLLSDTGQAIWLESWYEEFLKPELPYFLNWYGESGARFRELPHIEFREWRRLAAEGVQDLVEVVRSEGLG